MPVPTGDTLAKKSESVPISRTVNGQALDKDVTLTGMDIYMSSSPDADLITVAVKEADDKATQAIDEANAAYNKADDAYSLAYDKANRAEPGHADNLAALDNDGNPVDSGLSKDDVESLFFAQYYPEGNVKSAADFTQGIKYDFDTTNRTASVKPFCNTGNSANNNSSLVGRVVIPPFVDAQDNGYISDDGTRYKVVGVSGFNGSVSTNTNLTAVVVPNTVATVGDHTVGDHAFDGCTSLASVSLPSATSIGDFAVNYCTSLASVDFGATARSSVPTLGSYAFDDVPTTCKIIVPDSQYDAWTAASGWSSLVTRGYKFLRHSDWEYIRRYEIVPLLLAQYYPDGSVKSVAEFRDDIKYNLNDSNHTAMVKPFCNNGTAANNNSDLIGRVVIPPFVDAQSNPYISDDGTRYKVVGVGSGTDSNNSNENLTAVIAPSTVANIEDKAFRRCTKLASVSTTAATSIGSGAFNTCASLASVSIPAATSIGTYAFNSCTKLASVSIPAATNIHNYAFYNCTKLASVSLPSATSIGGHVFDSCTALASVSLPATTSVGGSAFNNCNSLASVSLPVVTSIDGYSFAGCTSLTSVDFGETLSSAPTLGSNAFRSVPTSCKIIVPDAQYDAWIAASGWSDLVTAGYKFLKHSEWEYVRRYEIDSFFFAQYYPDGSVKSSAEFTSGIKYDDPNTTYRTITVKPFCNTGDSENDNSGLAGRVVIPPFVDNDGNGYITDDGTRFRVVGIASGSLPMPQNKLTAIVAPNTVTNVGSIAFRACISLASVALPAATTIEGSAFYDCSSLASVSIPGVTSIGG